MKPEGRAKLLRAMYRVAIMYGEALATASHRDPTSLEDAAWVHGCFAAWMQLKTLLETGTAVEPTQVIVVPRR